MLMSPLKTTSSAFNCSTFIASSSWQASASWASYSQAENPSISGTASEGGRSRQGGTGSQLQGRGATGGNRGKHRQWGALTSWSSFTRSCSCIRTVYSSSHLADMGRKTAPYRCRVLTCPCSSQFPTCLAQASAPGSASLDGEELWTGMSGRPGGGQLQLSGGSTLPGQCQAPRLPSQNLWATHQQLYLRATAAAPLLHSARPAQDPAQPAVWLASFPTSCPHQTTRPTRPSLPPSVAQIRSRLLPAPEQSSSSLRPCLVWYHLTL